jgi:hypothetical protein
MRRIVLLIFTVLVAGAAIASCGFQLADDTGRPIPGQYWRWVCADGAPAGDGGCASLDGSADH